MAYRPFGSGARVMAESMRSQLSESERREIVEQFADETRRRMAARSGGGD